MRMNAPVESVDAYIAAAPADVQPLLRTMRETIARAAPGATEAIAYGMPTFRLHGNLVHFAAFKQHIGFYPGPDAITTFTAELAGVAKATAKGTIQFSLDRPLPVVLIAKITEHRVAVSEAKHRAKRTSRGTKPVPR